MIQVHYKFKKDLKAAIGQPLKYRETSIFGLEFQPNGSFPVADSSSKRSWFAVVTMKDSLIESVT